MPNPPDKMRRTTRPPSSAVKYTGPMRPDIQKLMDEYRNLYPALDDETFERLERNFMLNERKTSKIVLSARGRMVDGWHRCLILLNAGRKALTEDDYTVDYTAVDELSELKAHVGYQENSRSSTSTMRAAMARQVMRRYGWSAGRFAEEFGFKHDTVKKWLARNPDTQFDAEMAEIGRIGKDGKLYTDVPVPEGEDEADTEDAPPKGKAIRRKPSSGEAVVLETNRIRAHLTNPELREWVLREHNPDDRGPLVLAWAAIRDAADAIASGLDEFDAGDDRPFGVDDEEVEEFLADGEDFGQLRLVDQDPDSDS